VSEPPGGADQDGGWRRVHPATPLIRSWSGLLVLIAVMFGGLPGGGWDTGWIRELASGEATRGLHRSQVMLGAAVLLSILAVVALSLFASWRMTRYRITPDALELFSGVLFRRHRTARLDRLQAVNISQPFLARIVGLARLRLEVAGGGDSHVTLEYLREDHAGSLRNHLLARAAGLSYDTQEAPEAPGWQLASVPVDRLVRSILLSGAVVGFAVVLILAAGLGVVARSAGAVLWIVPTLLAAGSLIWNRFTNGFDFSLVTAQDGLRTTYGLLEKRSQTVAPGRVQAVEVDQTLLWRTAGWWRVRVNVAGHADPDLKEGTGLVLPVGTVDDVAGILPHVVPYLPLSAEPGVDLLRAGLTGSGEGGGFVTSPRRARFLDPWQWRRTGFLATDDALLIRHGRLRRTFVIVPHERVQSLTLSQGPLLARLGLATVGVHSTPGPVSPKIARLDAEVAARLVDEQAERSRHARERARPDRWMQSADPLEQPAEAAEPSGVEQLPGAGRAGGHSEIEQSGSL
jgi:putative membrane protein